ncbi:MAG: cytochrome c class I [Chitinophagaceae bacterium]|nr:cytochrome c class I [Chitinophagaceae bacterium]
MRRNLKMLVAAMVMLTVACAETAKEQNSTTTVVEEKKEDISSNPDYKKGLALVAANDCLTCHAVNQTMTGPAYADIAAKYANADTATIAKLAQTIIKGGSGNWGQVPMTPHPALSDAKAMVKYVLLLKQP